MTRFGSGLSVSGDPPLRERALFRLLIADADDAFRDLVKQHLGRVIAIVGDVGDGDEAVRMAKRLQPDVVLMDIAMPLIGGPEAARRIKADRAETKVVLLTSGDEKRDVVHADAVLPKKGMRAEILSHVGKLGRRKARR